MFNNKFQRLCWLALLWLLSICFSMNLYAQQKPLEEITVYSTRIEKPIDEVPSAVSVVDEADIQTGRQQLGLDEALVKIPGLFMQDRYNYAQDLRIAIRGFGARANFGIRGIRMYVDGIPATLPDGQSGVDSIDIGSTSRIEVIRGPSSSLYGSAAGGVISIYTEDGPDIPFIEARYAGGDDGYNKYQVKGGGQYKDLNYLVNLSRLDYEGYRDHTRTENVTFNSKFKYTIDDSSDFTTLINAIDAPVADDPGGLNAVDAAANPTSASAGNLKFDAGESITQQQVGFVYRKAFSYEHEITLKNYYVWRDFENRLPFAGTVAGGNGGNVQFQRFFVGGGATYNFKGDIFGRHNDLVIGFDFDAQQDERQRYVNNFGHAGALTQNQVESVDSFGIYFEDDMALTEQVSMNFSARYDKVDFNISDKFLSDGNDSGDLSFDNFNPMVALLWRPMDSVNLYAKYSTSFETPTTTELANPNGGGFNTALSPQKATNYEIGAKGLLHDYFRYELALFHIDMSDELVQYEPPATPGHFFFRNAGQSTREGLESAVSFHPIPELTVSATYTYSDFQYDKYSTPSGIYDGNTIPGLPENQIYAELNYQHPSGFYAVWDVLWTDQIYVDDANSELSSDYTVSNLRAGYKGEWGNWSVSPFVGINNLFDEHYIANIRINASFARFYEPAPDFNVYAGLSIRYHFF